MCPLLLQVGATLVVADPALREALQQELAVLALLAKLEQDQVQVVASADTAAPSSSSSSSSSQEPSSSSSEASSSNGTSSSSSSSSAAAPSISVVVREGVQVLLPMAGLFDVAKELARLDKQKQKVGARTAAAMVPMHHTPRHPHACLLAVSVSRAATSATCPVEASLLLVFHHHLCITFPLVTCHWAMWRSTGA
jgi:hypothetical protein